VGEKKSKVFGGKRYYLWDFAFAKGRLVRKAKAYRKAGLLVRVVKTPHKYAPRGVAYELYTHGSMLDAVRRVR